MYDIGGFQTLDGVKKKNHQSAQLGIEQLVLLCTPSEMKFFFGFARSYNQDVGGLNPDRYAARSYPRIEFTVFFFVLESHTKHKNKFVHKNLT